MDESALLDLLECPVCLERLDASAKVLPCQHTFCKRCLLGIVSSRNELRCPECRTLVDCSVDELPSNILLVRLLDGIKQRPWKPGTGGGTSCTNALRAQSSTVPSCGSKDPQSSQGGQQQRVQARSPPGRGIPQLPCAKALYTYEGKEPGDLKFNKGDIIILRRQVDENWYHGEVSGVHGFFPTNFVQIIKPLPQPPPQCKALYDFEVKDKEADKDCLPFSKDDVLTVIPVIIPHHSVASQQLQPQLSNAAAYVTAVNNNRSNVPLACAAASLNSSSITSASLDGDISGRAVSVHPGAPASPENALAAGGNTAVSKPDKDSKKEKKGLLKLLSGASTKRKPRVSPPSSPTLEVEQAAVEMALQGAVGPEVPSAVSHGRAGSCPVDNEISAATLSQETLHRKTSSLDSNIPIAPPPRQPCSSLGSVQNESRPVVCERYRVVVSYPPQSEAELELKEGDIVFVHKKREDGWFKGTLQRNGKTGLFPGSFVENI
uniref:E3 ubiquitin-protein ligase SH3RF1 n=1 Tax=Chelonoidis abingdonii TaxID=106734 RepID=A0A8C0GL19_CHEAB